VSARLRAALDHYGRVWFAVRTTQSWRRGGSCLKSPEWRAVCADVLCVPVLPACRCAGPAAAAAAARMQLTPTTAAAAA
jgi:sugar (pentulose or hexulose) kinase